MAATLLAGLFVIKWMLKRDWKQALHLWAVAAALQLAALPLLPLRDVVALGFDVHLGQLAGGQVGVHRLRHQVADRARAQHDHLQAGDARLARSEFRLVATPQQSLEAAAALPASPFAVLHPGSARPEKYWLPERWAEVAAHLHRAAHELVWLNPLLRYDAYYILSDLVEIPNLASRSMRYLGYLFERYAFGAREIEEPEGTPGEIQNNPRVIDAYLGQERAV